MIDHPALARAINSALTQAYGSKTPWHESDEEGRTGLERAQYESITDETVLAEILRLGIFAYQRQTLTNTDQPADHDTVTVSRQLFKYLHTAASDHEIMLVNRIADAMLESDRLSSIAEREYHRLCMDAAHIAAFRPEES